MSNQFMNRRKTANMAKLTELDVIAVLVRGGTDHHTCLLLRDGTCVNRAPNGDLYGTGNRHPCVVNEKGQVIDALTEQVVVR